MYLEEAIQDLSPHILFMRLEDLRLEKLEYAAADIVLSLQILL